MVNPPSVAQISPIAAPAPPKAPQPSGRAFATCTSDGEAMAKVPGRNMDDPVYKGRAFRTPTSWFPAVTPPTAGNEVIPYIYGTCVFADMAEAIKTAYLPEHRIYLIGWSTDKGVQLTPGSGGTLEDYLKASRAQIRGMFYNGAITLSPLLSIKTPVENKWIAQTINAQPNGAAIIDGRLPSLGIHHQKLLVVQGQFGLVAFIGGMDLAPSRVTVNPGAGEPWHDVQLRITGPAALNIRKIFEDRWLDHPESAALDGKLSGTPNVTLDQQRSVAFPPPAPLDRPALVSTTFRPETASQRANNILPYAAVGRTFGSKKAGGSYGFAPNGDYSAWAMIEHGIKQSLRWIYVEDQYLVSRMARKALLDRLRDPTFEYLLMVMNGSGAAAADFKFLVTARNEFRRDLMSIDPTRKRWGLFTLKDSGDPQRQQRCGSYLHSKTWIFDDGYVIVGSANCDNRGYTLDSECVAGYAEASTINVRIGTSSAAELRTCLWHKHLGVPHAHLRDFGKGVQFWRAPPPAAMVVDASAYELDNDLSPPAYFPDPASATSVDTAWSTFIDPDAR